MSTATVEMYIDPLCPWAWLTSRWLLEAEKVRTITVVTKVFSLAEVNAENEEYREFFQLTSRAVRLLVAARRAGGEAAIRTVYTELGEAHHERDQPLAEEVTLLAAANAAGIDPALVDAAINDADGSLQAEVLAEHRGALERGAFGVPTLSVDGSAAYFGPIVDRRVTGDDAGRLWDIALPMLLHPHVFELKRNRTSEPDVGRLRLRDAVGAAAG
jgi:predicted DsbA family dithiol-disulfide isomerase